MYFCLHFICRSCRDLVCAKASFFYSHITPTGYKMDVYYTIQVI